MILSQEPSVWGERWPFAVAAVDHPLLILLAVLRPCSGAARYCLRVATTRIGDTLPTRNFMIPPAENLLPLTTCLENGPITPQPCSEMEQSCSQEAGLRALSSVPNFMMPPLIIFGPRQT